MVGEYTIPSDVFCSPSRMITSVLCADKAAPMTPKMSAWLDDVGSAATNVMRSQMIAATSAATTTSCDTTALSTIPLPTVFDNASPVRAKTTFSALDIMIG